MRQLRARPVESFVNLRTRVDRLFRARASHNSRQGRFDVFDDDDEIADLPSSRVQEFLDFLADALPTGEVYLFGGVLRDIALYGRRGFNSDVDVVVEGDWGHCVQYLRSIGARQNKFGGYRFELDDWPIDIWNAEETWAVRKGIVDYRGIGSLTGTTILNWDAILMNWRTRVFVARPQYLEELNKRILDIVLEFNPNPVGMIVRVFRHLCAKDAQHITLRAARFLADSAAKHSYKEIGTEEFKSYGNSLIDPKIYRLFETISEEIDGDIDHKYKNATERLQKELFLL